MQIEHDFITTPTGSTHTSGPILNIQQGAEIIALSITDIRHPWRGEGVDQIGEEGEGGGDREGGGVGQLS